MSESLSHPSRGGPDLAGSWFPFHAAFANIYRLSNSMEVCAAKANDRINFLLISRRLAPNKNGQRTCRQPRAETCENKASHGRCRGGRGIINIYQAPRFLSPKEASCATCTRRLNMQIPAWVSVNDATQYANQIKCFVRFGESICQDYCCVAGFMINLTNVWKPINYL